MRAGRALSFDHMWLNELSGSPALEVSLLGADPTKAAALITPLPLAAAALVVTGTFGLALASWSWGTGAATAIERNGVFGGGGGKRSSRSRAAGKFRAAASSI